MSKQANNPFVEFLLRDEVAKRRTKNKEKNKKQREEGETNNEE